MPSIRITRREAERELLPRVCALTGVPTDDVKVKKFSWYPPWVNLTILIAWPVALVLSLVLRKEMIVHLPLVRAKHGHWLWRQLFAVFGLLGSIALAVGGGITAGRRETEQLGLILLFSGLGLFLATLIFLIVLNYTTLRPTEITDRDMTLTGVHQNFIDALEEERDRDEEEYQRRKDQWRERQRGRGRADEEEDDRRSGPPRARRPVNRDDDLDDGE